MSGRALLLLIVIAAAAFSGAASAADLILDEAGLSSADGYDVFERKHGEITVPSGIGLVSHGAYRGTGTLTKVELPDPRMHVVIGETRGTVSTDAGSSANPFATLGKRKTVHVSSEAWEAAGTGLSFNGTAVETERVLRDDRTGLPVGEAYNRAFGAGMDIAGYDNRVRGLAELAWARDSRPDPASDVAAQRSTMDAAWRVRLEADLVSGEGHKLEAWGQRRRVDPGYVAVRGDAPTDRDEIAMGTAGRWGPVKLDIAFVQFTNNLDHRKDVLTIRDSAGNATLGFDLVAIGLAYPAPSALRLSASHRNLTGEPDQSTGTFAVEAITDRYTSSIGIATDWPSPILAADGTLSLQVSRSQTDDQTPAAESADSTENTVGLVQGVRRPTWTASIGASASAGRRHEDGNRARTLRFSMTATAAATAKAPMPFLVSTSVTQLRTTGLDAAVNGDLDTTWEITAGAQLNRLLGMGSAPATPPLAAYVRLTGNDPDLTQPDERMIDITAGVRARLRF